MHDETPPEKQEFTPLEAADYIGVSDQSVYNWIAEGVVRQIRRDGFKRPRYFIPHTEVERLRQEYGAKNDLAVAAQETLTARYWLGLHVNNEVQTYCSTHARVREHGTCGGATGIRTPDLLRAKQTLSQLSYCPEIVKSYELKVKS